MSRAPVNPELEKVLNSVFDTLDTAAQTVLRLGSSMAAPVSVIDQLDAAMHHLHRYVCAHPEDACVATVVFSAMVSSTIKDVLQHRRTLAGLGEDANVLAVLECPPGTPVQLAEPSGRLVAHSDILFTEDEHTQEQEQNLQHTSHIVWHVYEENVDAWKVLMGVVANYYLRCRSGEMDFVEMRIDGSREGI
jgi:hypothetical protein